MPTKKQENNPVIPELKHKFSGKYISAVGRRKTSTARVRFYDDKKKRIIINDKNYTEYLSGADLIREVEDPLRVAGKMDASISVKVAGGGSRGQAEAIRHGITRVILKIDKDLRATLKPLGFVTRDPRKKERKKPGLKRARRAPQ